MALIQNNKRLFGVALDPSDDPWSLELKQAWMNIGGQGMEGLAACRDPYDAVTNYLRDILDMQKIEPAGKFSVPSWLTPKPDQSDYPQVNAQNIGLFYDCDGLTEIIRQLQGFVEEKIFPATPVMVGVDHAATMGVISALARKYGPETLSVIVLDQHFDAIPMSVRVAEASGTIPNPMGGMPLKAPEVPADLKDHCCCGNFWEYLLKEGQILPQNLSFVGIADYPGDSQAPAQKSPFRDCYLSFQEKGCRSFPMPGFEGHYLESLTRFIKEGTQAPNIYVSLDLDVGSYNFTCAARYMDRPGISTRNLLDVAQQIHNLCQQEKNHLVGFDIMEFNMHFLGIETEDGTRDTTIETVGEYIKALTG